MGADRGRLASGGRLTTARHRLFYWPGLTELYDLERTLANGRSHAARTRAAASRRERSSDTSNRLPLADGVPQVELDDMQLGQLRALGYVVEGSN